MLESILLPLVAAACLGLAIHIRPDAVLYLPAVLLLTLSREHWKQASFVGVVAGSQLLFRPVLDVSSQNVLRPERLEAWHWVAALLPRTGPPVAEVAFQVALHTAFTPFVVPLFAVLGLMGTRGRGPTGSRDPGGMGWRALAWIGCLTVAVVSKSSPLADAWRLQLGAQLGWVLLGALGVAEVGQRSRRLGWAAAASWLLPLALALPSTWPGWANQQEWQFLREVVPGLRPGTVVAYDPNAPRAEKFAAVMETLGPARWEARTGEQTAVRQSGPDEVVLVYRAVDSYRSDEDWSGCEAVEVTTLAGEADVDVVLPEEVVVGFYRCGLKEEW